MKIIVCRTAEVVWHTFFYCKSKNVSYLCSRYTKIMTYGFYPFLLESVFSQKHRRLPCIWCFSVLETRQTIPADVCQFCVAHLSTGLLS